MKQIIKRLATSITALLLSWCIYAQPNITRVEYYIDGDPGYGKATALSIMAGPNLVNLAININPANLTEGVHFLGARAQDANGAWSQDNRWMFAKPYASDTTGPGALPNISRVEYYLDSDPGYGKATAVTIGSGTDLSNLAINIDPATLTEGVHVLGVRSRDAKGAWSFDNKWLFAKPYASDTIPYGPAPDLKRIEYYIDTDPGYGKGIQVAQENVTNINNLGISINISGLAKGSHTLYIRSKDANSWSLDNKWDFTIGTAVTGAAIMVNSVSKKALCAGENFSVGYDAKGTYNAGNTFTVQLSNGTGSFASPTTIGIVTSTALNGIIACSLPASITTGTGYKVRVVSTNTALTGTSSVDALTINALPPTPTITPNGATTFCQGGSVTLTCSSGTSYLWNTGATTQSITVNASGNYTVTVKNAGGCSKSSAATVVTVNPKPVPITTPSGNVSINQGSNVTISVNGSYSSYTVTTGSGCTSDPVVVTYIGCADPTSLAVNSITATSATLSWTAPPCATKYTVQYRIAGTTGWTKVTATTPSLPITGVTAGTQYQWNVTAVCGGGTKSAKITGPKFTTAAAIISAKVDDMQTGAFTAALFPNPAKDRAVLQVSGPKGKVFVMITDITGKPLWQSGGVNSAQIQLPVGKLSNGTYLVHVTSGTENKTIKLIKTN